MSRKCVEVKTLHGYTLQELDQKINDATNTYTRSYLMAITMRYKGINTNDIMKALNKSRPTITDYINRWNNDPLSIIDNRGGNIASKLDDDILTDLKDLVINKSPSEFGFPQSTWNSEILSVYIDQTYKCKFTSSWIRAALRSLGFSYKRGVYKPSNADPELQEQFKKNDNISGYI
jgi:transposase